MDRDKRVGRLIQYIEGIRDNKNGKELYIKYQNDIENVKPQEAFEIFYSMFEKGMEPKAILVFLDKIINVFYKSLSSYKWERPKNDNFLRDLELENEALKIRINNIKKLFNDPNLHTRKKSMLIKVRELIEFDGHYLKKENILFPYMEKKEDKYNGLSIMWALHDEVRGLIKDAIVILELESSSEEQINKSIAALFFGMLGIVKKEELILFPTASEILNEEEWYEMHKQSLEYSFPFIDKKVYDMINPEDKLYKTRVEAKFISKTGEIDFEQLLLIFKALPVDITFVDENNKVKFFSDSRDRIFSRSPAVIGREVRNCHPPASVHVVEEIVESFRTGKEDKATFWINIKGKMILIQYFALRDEDGNFKGTLEVSQDITEIKALEGERRILQWKSK
jgi:PAS domain S-box-containing protein